MRPEKEILDTYEKICRPLIEAAAVQTIRFINNKFKEEKSFDFLDDINKLESMVDQLVEKMITDIREYGAHQVQLERILNG